ncbi:MAG TPA: S8 family serine peptidase [Streptosporangiaceae bacterium]|nr:S8 family serine peptidase [Streptosporangiaceae bacterium]
MLNRYTRLSIPVLALAGVIMLTGAAAPASEAAQVRAAEQGQLRAIEAPAAWPLSTGRGVTVAVLDTGVDPAAADLAGSVITGPDYTRGADPPGYQPPHLHGTFIASLIAGHGSGPGRADGIIGVAPAARVLSVRVILDDQEPGLGAYNSKPRYAGAIEDGIRYATRHGAQVINMSLGTSQPRPGMQAALGYAVSHGVLVVASAGNSGGTGPGYTPYSYPAAFTGVISVAAVNDAGQRAPFSDRNSSVVLSAPGVGIIGAGPGVSYLQASGTSPAAAFVTGVAALIRSAYPRLAPAEVVQALISSARHRPAAGYSPATGFGEVDAVAALRAAGRLAAARPGTGLAAGSHFGGAPPGAIQVTRRDAPRVAVLAGVAAAGGLGFLVALVVLAILTARAVRDRRRLAGRPQPGSAAGPAGPGGPDHG